VEGKMIETIENCSPQHLNLEQKEEAIQKIAGKSWNLHWGLKKVKKRQRKGR
jgi:hypothetical protein